MADLAALGKQALDDKNYTLAAEKYTVAIDREVTNRLSISGGDTAKDSANDKAVAAAKLKVSPNYFIQRSITYVRLERFEEALEDAEQAIRSAEDRAKRELITEAQFRRGVALFKLNRNADAAAVFDLVKQRDDKHKQVDIWAKMNQDILAKLKESTSTTSPASSSIPAQPKQSVAPKKPNWFQSSNSVTLELYVKGITQDKAQVDIDASSLSISFPLDNGSSYQLSYDPLFAPVVSEDCKVKFLPTKIEVTLVKARPGQKWSALESSDPSSTQPSQIPTSADSDVKRAVLADTKSTAPAYPTSSRSGPKNWDKITSDLTRKTDSTDGAAGAGDLDDDDDDDGGDPANAFFKKLYKDASPEVRRAMMKSYTESNGTSLSTNWDEVSKGPVETLPPDGMEAKKW